MKRVPLFVVIVALFVGAAGLGLFWFKPHTFAVVRHEVSHGKVVRIFPSPDLKDNVVTYDTEIRVANDDLALKPGMTANVTVVLARKADVPILSKSALRVRTRHIRAFYPEMPEAADEHAEPRSAEEERRRFFEGRGVVWVYRDGFPEPVAIRFGATDTKNMEILEGLREGDEVIVGIKPTVGRRLAGKSGSP